MKKILHHVVYFALLLLCQNLATAQTTLNPADPMVVYNPDQPPADPPWGSIGKWVYTPNASVTWDHSSFKSYIYKGMSFRLKFPKTYQHGVVDGRKYPVFLFFHGRGESRPATDNNWILLNGGKKFRDAVDNGSFDGYLMYPQTPGLWGDIEYDKISELLDSMAQFTKADLNRICVNGLSAGGYASWEFMIRHPEKVAASMPMSGVSNNYLSAVNDIKYQRIWLFQGGLDGSPAPYTAQTVVNAVNNAGGDIKYTLYPNDAHNTWTDAWNEADFIPFMGRYNSLNPKALFKKTTLCPGETVTIGIPPGCDGYEWQKDNAAIAGATSNQINVTTPGTYRARVKRVETWSEWSPVPLIITYKPTTPTPAIAVSNTASSVLPSPDGNTSVVLRLPEGMEQYEWKRVGTASAVGTEPMLSTSAIGKYMARVKATNNCISAYSDTFPVVNSNGPNGPPAISGLMVSGITKTQATIKWNNVAAPPYNEKFFEVYRAKAPGGPYTMAGKAGADVLTFTDQDLTPATSYYYIVRPVNDNAAGPVSAETKAITQTDTGIPVSPRNLAVTSTSNFEATLTWAASTDDAGIDGYEIYVNGTRALTTGKSELTATVSSLAEGTVFNFVVKAKDVAGKLSPPSNQVTAVTKKSGLSYKFYKGTWSTLPNFSTLTPTKTGRSVIPDLAARTGGDDSFGFLWTGYIRIPVAGTYTFETNSDEGSKFYFNKTYSSTATATVDNNGIHTARFRSGTVTVAAGIYPIAVTYFERTGSQVMELHWTCPQLGVTSRQQIPGMYLLDTANVTLTKPGAPTNAKAVAKGHDKIEVSWTDVSSIETGFEIYRSTSYAGTYFTVATVGPNVTKVTDTALTGSTTYYYKIRTIAGTGESAWSNVGSAKTAAKPSVPGAPSNLTAQALTTESIKLTWKDNSAIETGFEVYRATGDGTVFTFLSGLDSLPGMGGQRTFTDVSLAANTKAWYKVRAVGEGGASAYTATVSATTKTNPPVIQPIPSQTIRYGTVADIAVDASDPDNDPITYRTLNLPAFGSLVQSSGEVYLHFAPAQAQQGTYNNIGVIATDSHNASDTAYFNLVVNDNYPPVIQPPSDVNVNEGSVTTVKLRVTDQNSSETFTWTALQKPAFVTLSSRNDSCLLTVEPGYADAGSYPIRVQVKDNRGGIDEKSFTLVVADMPSPGYRLRINFSQSGNGPAPWNNVNNFVTNNLKDDQGAVTNVGLTFDSWWWATSVDGATTGNNSGVYPDVVMKEYLYFGSLPGFFSGAPNMPGRLTGLDADKTYSIRFFSSSTWWAQPNNGTTTFTINGVTKSIAVQGNTTNTVIFENLTPNGSGEISFDVSRASGSNVGYLNAMEVNAVSDGPDAMAAEQSRITMAADPGKALNNKPDAAVDAMEVNVYPNPFTTNLAADVTLKTAASVMIEVWDISGRNLYREYRPAVPEGRTTIRLNNLKAVDKPGIYLLKLSSNKGESKVVRVVKQ